LKVLFDHNVDRRLRNHLPGHEVRTAREMGWEQLENGVLLKVAADNGFEALISIDKKLEHERNLQTLPLPVVIIDSRSNALPALAPFAPFLLDLLRSPLDRQLYILQPGGAVVRLTKPRS
jgi:hypothetical protein